MNARCPEGVRRGAPAGAAARAALARLVPLLLLAVLALAVGQAGAAEDGAAGADLDREQRLRDQIVDAIFDGEPIDLRTPDGLDFLAIYTEAATADVHGTVILLHGRGLHPDWVNTIQPLRVGLTRHGWHTLSIQLPVLGKGATYDDYFEVFPAAGPRIEAAIEAARSRADGRIVLLAHSCGAHMAQHWMLAGGAEAIAQFDAFIGIGMGATDYGQPMREPYALDRIEGPVLDVYAESDYRAVRRMAMQRKRLIEQAGNPASRQVVVADAEHYFVERGEPLLMAIADWLKAWQAMAPGD